MFQNTSTTLRQAGNIKIIGAKVYLKFIHFEGKAYISVSFLYVSACFCTVVL